MINAADLPAIRARAEGAEPPADNALIDSSSAAEASAPCYPSKKLALENGRYVVAEHDK